MARMVLHGIVLLAVLGSAHTAHAEADVPDEVAAVADQAGVDPLALLGAVATTNLAPADYLCRVGEMTCPVPPLMGAVARADCVISKESGGLDIPNRQGSGAMGPGQYFPSTWTRHVAVYRAATGYLGPLSLHVLADVRRVMAYVLSLPAWPHNYRAEWAVGGC